MSQEQDWDRGWTQCWRQVRAHNCNLGKTRVWRQVKNQIGDYILFQVWDYIKPDWTRVWVRVWRQIEKPDCAQSGSYSSFQTRYRQVLDIATQEYTHA